MGELSPVLEGHLKYREGKKWKQRYARIIRLSPVADCLTLLLWRDGREAERGVASTKGSINLNDYIGCEAGFNLDKEANTLALIFKEMVVLLAFDDKESLIKWQVRVCNQFEEGQQFPVHLVTSPKKTKLNPGPMRIHLQNLKFSLTQGVPPVLVHSWDLVDLRRYGSVEGGRFCFEGGTRCGKGEGLHVFRVDNPEDLQISFDLASKGKLENKKRAASTGFAMSTSPSVSSSLNTSSKSELSNSSLTTLLQHSSFRSSEDLDRARSRSRSKSVNPSLVWSSVDGGLALSSPDTLSLTLSEVDAAGVERLASPDHLVNRRAVLERIGMGGSQYSGVGMGAVSDMENSFVHNRSQASSRSCGSEDDFFLNLHHEKSQSLLHQPQHPPPYRRQGSYPCNSIDRMSHGSGDSCSTTYDHPKTVLKVTSSPLAVKRTSGVSSPVVRRQTSDQRLSSGSQVSSDSGVRRQIISDSPCPCDQSNSGNQQAYGNYDIPRNLGRQEALQFYDTPRNVREAMESSGQGSDMGNYDIPKAGVLPVFKKPCGCVLKLTSDQSHDQVLTWTCVKEEGDLESELKIPRVKLTGQGRMPVVDMSKINANTMRCLSEPPSQDQCQQNVSSRPLSPRGHGLPPPHPGHPSHTSPQHALYAQVNKARKTSQRKQVSSSPVHANYTNLEFANSLALYENSRDVLSRVAEMNNGHETNHGDYIKMSPGRSVPPPPGGDNVISANMDKNLHHLTESLESMALMSDSKYNTIKQMPRTGVSKTEYESSEQVMISDSRTQDVLSSGYVTMPRCRDNSGQLVSGHQSAVTMRRSASVPCKHRDRDSCSSGGSDSGVSTGSPRHSINDQILEIHQ